MNNNNIRAIVIMYRGPEITDEGMKNVREYLATLLGLEIVPEGYILDDTDIARSIAASTVITVDENGAVLKPVEKNPVEHGIIFIAASFQNALKESATAFASELAAHVSIARYNGVNSELMKAVSAVTNGSYSDIRPDIRRKYGISRTVFDVIQRIGRHV